MHGLLQLHHFWSTFRLESANKNPYQANIGSMRLRLQELQEIDSEVQELQSKKDYEEVKEVLHH